MSEGNGAFWRYLQKLLPVAGHYTRIEAHDTAPGFPDVHYTLDGSSGTIELKSAAKPGAKYPFSGKSGLRANQRRWIADEVDGAMGRVFLALQCGDRVCMMRADLYYDELHRMTEDDLSRVAGSVRWVKRDHTPAHIKAIHDLLTAE